MNQARIEYERIIQALGLRTQMALADELDIRQSSISDALSRDDAAGLPAGWKLKLLEKHALSPDWIRSGEGCMYMAPVDGKPEWAGPVGAVAPEKRLSTEELVMELAARLPDCLLTISRRPVASEPYFDEVDAYVRSEA